MLGETVEADAVFAMLRKVPAFSFIDGRDSLLPRLRIERTIARERTGLDRVRIGAFSYGLHEKAKIRVEVRHGRTGARDTETDSSLLIRFDLLRL